MSTLEKAIIIATKAHSGQVDKGGHPYILHPLAVMMNVETNVEKIVAVLHDVLEDTELTLNDLESEGFGYDVLIPLGILTKGKGVSYDDYIKQIAKNNVARNVKIQDIRNNMDLSRIENLSKKDFERNKKYKKALHFLINSYLKDNSSKGRTLNIS